MRNWLLSMPLLLLPTLAYGQSCGTVQVVRNRNVVVKERVDVVAAVLTPFFVPVATYGAGYVGPGYYPPPPPQPAAAAPPDGNAALLAELKRLNGRLDAIERGRAAPQQQPAMPPAPDAPQPQAAVRPGQSPGQAVLARACASCHGGPSPKGGLALFDPAGTLLPLSDRDARRVLTSVYAGRMPKGDAKLNDNEVGEVVAYFDGLK